MSQQKQDKGAQKQYWPVLQCQVYCVSYRGGRWAGFGEGKNLGVGAGLWSVAMGVESQYKYQPTVFAIYLFLTQTAMKTSNFLPCLLITILFGLPKAVEILPAPKNTTFPANQPSIVKSDQLLISSGRVPKVTYQIAKKSNPSPETKPIQNPSQPAPKYKNITMTYDEFLILYRPNNRPTPGSCEYVYRQYVFQENLKSINEHNSKGTSRFRKGVNVYADLTPKEFVAMYVKLILPEGIDGLGNTALNGTLNTSKPTSPPPNLRASMPQSSTPSPRATNPAPISFTDPQPNTTIDWSCLASPLLTQGLCGSCYIIAPLQSIYITLRIYGQKVDPLSVQEVLACGPGRGGRAVRQACQGGYFDSAYEYNMDQGTGSALLYPYDARAFGESVVSPCNVALISSSGYRRTKVQIKGAEYIAKGDCAKVVEILKTRALAVSVDAENLQFYAEGTFDQVAINANHGVTLVGYDQARGYKIKNSWGTSWGLNGFGFMSRETGVCAFPMYPVTGFEDPKASLAKCQ